MSKPNTELQTAYLAIRNACTFCESRDIEGGSTLEVDGSGAWQEITCPQCRARWNANYTLTSIEVLDDPRLRRYQFQATGGLGNDIDISFDNINRLADLNPEHEPATIMALEVGQTLTYSHWYTLVRLEDAETVNIGDATECYTKQADGAAALTIDMAKEPQPITSVWYDYTNQAWVMNGVYLTCGHPKDRPCYAQGTGHYCYGRLYAGETPAQNLIEQYANAQMRPDGNLSIALSLSDAWDEYLKREAQKADILQSVPDQKYHDEYKDDPNHSCALCEEPFGHCDTCGAICDSEGCTNVRTHQISNDDEHPLDRADREHNEDQDAGLDEPAGYGS